MSPGGHLANPSMQTAATDLPQNRDSELGRKRLPDIGPQQRGCGGQGVEPVERFHLEADTILADSNQRFGTSR